MATAQEVIDRAGGLLQIVDAPGSAVDTTTSAAMLTVLQDMVSDFGEDGLLEIPAPSALGDSLDVSPGTIRALTYNLAKDYAPFIGKTQLGDIPHMAERLRSRLVAESVVSRKVSFRDGGLTTSYGRYNINTDA